MQQDAQLILKLQQGDEQAFSLIYDRYSGAIYNVILKMCKDEALAQDLLQETFLSIWKKSNQYNPEKGRFYTWAYRIARHKVLNYIRSEKKLIQQDDLGVYNYIEETRDNKTELPALKGAILKLEAHHQEALTLVYFNGLTHKEAHESMGVPLGTFKSYIQQAIRELRKHYKELVLSVIVFLMLLG